MTATMRHATRKAYESGCRCDSCRLHAVLLFGKNGEPRAHQPQYNEQRRVKRQEERRWANNYRMVDVAPYRVVIQALRDQGVTMVRMAEVTQLSRWELGCILNGHQELVNPQTKEKLRSLLALLPSEVSA